MQLSKIHYSHSMSKSICDLISMKLKTYTKLNNERIETLNDYITCLLTALPFLHPFSLHR